jgi:phage FluMu gp28-like protein
MWLLRRVGDVLWTDQIRVFEKTLFRVQLEAAAELIRQNRVARCCIDSTGIGAMLAEELQLRFGEYTVEQVQFTAPVKIELGMPLLQAFQDRAIRIPADPVIREDLHKIRKTVTAANNVRLEADSDEAGHADRFWALALAVHAAAVQTCGRIAVFGDTRRAQAIAARRDRSIAA